MTNEAIEKIVQLLYFDFEEFPIGSVAEMSWREGSPARRGVFYAKAKRILSELESLGYIQPKLSPVIRNFISANRLVQSRMLKEGDIVYFKPYCQCPEVQGKIINISAPSLGGERMLLIEAHSEHFEGLYYEVRPCESL